MKSIRYKIFSIHTYVLKKLSIEIRRTQDGLRQGLQQDGIGHLGDCTQRFGDISVRGGECCGRSLGRWPAPSEHVPQQSRGADIPQVRGSLARQSIHLLGATKVLTLHQYHRLHRPLQASW